MITEFLSNSSNVYQFADRLVIVTIGFGLILTLGFS